MAKSMIYPALRISRMLTATARVMNAFRFNYRNKQYREIKGSNLSRKCDGKKQIIQAS